MSADRGQLSRVYNNLFGGAGVQTNLGNLARSFQEGSRKGSDVMGCTWSGLTALYDSLNGGQEIVIKDRKFKVLRKLGEGGFAFVYLVKEVGDFPPPIGSTSDEGESSFALKKFLIQSREQLQLVRQEIDTCTKFKHPSLLPLLAHAVVTRTGEQGAKEAYLLFPVYPEGTLQDHIMWLTEKDPPPSHPERLSPTAVLEITKQVASGLEYMHSLEPPYAHNDLKPGNILVSTKGGRSEGIKIAIMDFGSAAPARREVRSRGDALNVQEWASQHCSAAYRAPELWDTPSNCNIDERTDSWSLGCTVYALMFGMSPFERSLGETGGSVQLSVMSGAVKWPARSPYPQGLHGLVTWMLQLDPNKRPYMREVLESVESMLAKLPPTV